MYPKKPPSSTDKISEEAIDELKLIAQQDPNSSIFFEGEQLKIQQLIDHIINNTPLGQTYIEALQEEEDEPLN